MIRSAILVAFLASSCGLHPGPAADSAFALEMLAAQNAARANAMPEPSPALSPLTWSAEAAAVAQTWADRCDYRHNLDVPKGYGENIAASSGVDTRTNTQMVALWSDEASDYDYVTNTCAPAKECGHYLQVVARVTTQVGCAMATCHGDSPFLAGQSDWQFWVCDYTPSRGDQRPY